MKQVQLGKSGIHIAPIVFGGNVFGWTADEAQSFRLLDACVSHGINMIDTADVYSAWVPGNKGGESEQVIGNWLQQSGKRDQVVLATKVGMQMPDSGKGLSKKHIIEGAEAALKRLQTDYIDVFYAHMDDDSVPFAETFAAFQSLLESGKVRAIASSNYSAERLRQALQFCQENDLPQYVAHQPEYNLFDRSGYELSLEPVCEQYGLGVLTYFSLASGFLSGKYRNEADLKNASRKDFLGKYLNPRGLSILDALNQVATAHNAPIAAVSLAWILQRPSVTAPIVSATSTEQLQQLCEAASLTLSDAEMQLLYSASEE